MAMPFRVFWEWKRTGGREKVTSEDQSRAVLSLAVVMLWNHYSWFCRASQKVMVGQMVGPLKVIAVLLRRGNPGLLSKSHSALRAEAKATL